MKIAIYGYGNVGKAVERMARYFPDLETVAIFSHRKVEAESAVPVLPCAQTEDAKGKIDVMINCGGSAVNLPITTPMLAANFNVIDSFDTHGKIAEHIEKTDKAARGGDNIAMVSAGWDPGLFSIARLAFSSFITDGDTYTLWGRGVSQGHSDAIRNIDGVEDARQYTVPSQEAMRRILGGEKIEDAHVLHVRECYVVPYPGADTEKIEKSIRTMPDYFVGYNTEIHFIDKDTMKKEHSTFPHAGRVIRKGKAGYNTFSAELCLSMSSNPCFTASVMLAYARAVHRMYLNGERGCKTVFDIPMSLLAEDMESIYKYL